MTDAEIRRLALRCLLLGFVGPVPPKWLLHGLAAGLGGVVLFGSNLTGVAGTAALTRRLRSAAGTDIVVGLDEEGGDVTRLDQRIGSLVPGAAALGFLDDPVTTTEVYASIGTRLASIGVTLDLAPVADINSDPRNPVIGVRSFGAKPAVVTRHVVAAVTGLQRTGIAACVKHFPGHGATAADSHHGVATLDRSAADLETMELQPFRGAITASARAVMTGHLLVPGLDPDAIATVSRPIVTELLRKRLGFDGTIVTDAMEMRAVAGTIGMVESFVLALIAGADLVETGALDYPDMLEAGPSAVVQAVHDGRLPLGRLQDAAERAGRLTGAGDAAAAVDQALVDGAPARCLEIVGSLPKLTAPLIVECRTPNGMATGELPWSLADRLAAVLPRAQVLTCDDVTEVPDSAELVLIVRNPDRFPWQRRMIAHCANRPRLVLVDVGWPAPLAPDVPYVRTRGVSPGLLAAAAQALIGRAREPVVVQTHSDPARPRVVAGDGSW